MTALVRTLDSAPEVVEFFHDTRGNERALRVTWHHEADIVNLSMWRGHDCVSSFRLAIEEVPHLIEALRAGLDSSYAVLDRTQADSAARDTIGLASEI